jgi:hypothetical protein
MERHFDRRGKWFALGLLALVFLCIVACIGAATLHALRPAGIWMQPPAVEGGAVPPTVYYPAYGIGAFLGGAIGLLSKLVFFGLLAVLFLKLVGRLFWGRWHYAYGPWRCAPEGAAEGEAEAAEPAVGWGARVGKRRTWRHHRHAHSWGPPPWWGPQPPSGSEAQAQPEAQAESGEDEPDGPAGEYTGPME